MRASSTKVCLSQLSEADEQYQFNNAKDIILKNIKHTSLSLNSPCTCTSLCEALRRQGETRRVSAYVGYRSDLLRHID